MMVAILVGGLLIAGILRIYVSANQSTRVQTGLLTVQEKMRFLHYLFAYRVRMVGYAECDRLLKPVQQTSAIFAYHAKHGDALVLGECYRYQGHLQFMRMKYFVATTARTNHQQHRVMALFQQPVGGQRVELVTGVNHMQLQFGLATPDGKNIQQMLPAAQIKNWKLVKSVDMTLWLLSRDHAIKKAVHFYLRLRERYGWSF